MEKNIIFSVVVPTYNRKKKLMQCLKSLYDQDFPASQYEIIIVDDCSTDGTYQHLAKEEVVVLRLKKRLGPAAARNFGVSKAKGRFIAFLDSDCIAPSNWLSTFLNLYKKYPTISGVGGGIINDSKSIFGRYDNFIYSKYIKKNKEYISTKRDEAPCALGNISFDKKVFLDIGGFNEKFPYFISGEDAELKERLLRQKKKLLYTPIFVKHDRDFSLRDFYKQTLTRGADVLLYTKRSGKMQTKSEIITRYILGVILAPVYFIYALVRVKWDLRLVIPEFLFSIFRNYGKLKYYNLVSKLNI